MSEQTLGIIKPDAVKRNLIGDILKKVEVIKGEIIQLKMITPTEKQVKKILSRA